MKKAIYAGSFDPITDGHLWMIKESAKLFDHLVVAVAVNPTKKCLFSLEERKKLIEQTIDPLTKDYNIKVTSFDTDYQINYALMSDAKYIVRGIRNVNDFVYESGMANINHDILLLSTSSDEVRRQVSTVFLMPPRELAEVSSSLVKSLVGPNGWEDVVAKYVSKPVWMALKDKKERW